jgi:hypothetical protein
MVYHAAGADGCGGGGGGGGRGSHYVGEFAFGKKGGGGGGCTKYADGNEYDGTRMDDAPHSALSGVVRYADGSVYEGGGV